MADIELYAMAIANSEKDKDAFKGAIAIGSFLIGYTSACKSLLDACSITLNSLYNLSLKNKEQDFTKNKFWKTLETRSPETYSRYVRFHSLFTQIVKWRDAAVHRITPLVIVHSSGDPEKKPRDQVNIRLAANPNFNLSDIANAPLNIQWVEPLALHKQWHSDLIALCEQICLDIKLNSLGH